MTAVTTLRQQRRDVLDYLTASAAAIRKEPAPSLTTLSKLYSFRSAKVKEKIEQ